MPSTLWETHLCRHVITRVFSAELLLTGPWSRLTAFVFMLKIFIWLVMCVQKQWRELSREDQEPLSESPPPPQPPKCTERYNGSKLSHLEDGMDPKTGKKTGLETPNKESDRDVGTKYVARHYIRYIWCFQKCMWPVRNRHSSSMILEDGFSCQMNSSCH